ncbi:MAG: PH domain-containing protein [Propionibacteriales bacterium]|nr:PH domain-containing protein [Propionibacteriales bacterium]
MDASLFRPADEPWTPVSPALTTHRRLTITLPLLGLAALAGAAAATSPSWPVALGWTVLMSVVAGALLVGSFWTWWWADRNRRSWGWSESEDDLLVTSGVMFRRLVVVPYGRVQFVDVEAGPVEQRLGIAHVTLNTASTQTAAEIPGLPAEEARRLRDRLTDLGRAHDAGV